MKTFLTIIWVSICLTNCWAKGAWRDADDWRRMKFDAKIYYVNGVYDGLAGAPSLVESNDEAERLRATVGKVFRGIEAAQMVKAVDGFYRVSANREIPISGAVIYCAIVGWSGVPQATKDAFLHELRTRKK